MPEELYFEDLKVVCPPCFLQPQASKYTTNMSKAITRKDIQKYCELTGETNKSHTEQEYARQFGFRERLVPGYYLLALAAGLVRQCNPLKIVAITSTNAKFMYPVYEGDEIYVASHVISKTDKPGKGYGKVKISRLINNQHTRPCIEQIVELLIEKREKNARRD